jgi:hypothetical protein
MDLFLLIFHLQDCTKRLPFTYGLWTTFTDFSFARLYQKSSFQLWIMDLFLPIFNLQIVLKVFPSPKDYGPLLPIFPLQDCTKSLSFTYAAW